MKSKTHYFRVLSLSLVATALTYSAQANTMPGCPKDVYDWELTSKDCEIYLPNIHYADRVLNQQLAELRIKRDYGNGKQEYRYQIDRLIYPVIAAPNLFFKNVDPGAGANVNDELVVLLNLETREYQGLLTAESQAKPKTVTAKLNFDPRLKSSGIFIYLTSRNQEMRDGFTTKSASFMGKRFKKGTKFELTPMIAFRYAQPGPGTSKSSNGHDLDEKGIPAALATRDKLKLIFNQDQMAHVPAGFYDIRMEIVKDGRLTQWEFQYNAVRVFGESKNNQKHYEVINVTDSQISLGEKKILPGNKSFRNETHDRVEEFVNYLRDAFEAGKTASAGTPERKIYESKFITFNGDVHNGGSPLNVIDPEKVSLIYNDEAHKIIKLLKGLPIPIFLTIGNHDGYVNVGAAPMKADKMLKFADNMKNQGAIEATELADYKAFLQKVKDGTIPPGGIANDVHTGSLFIRRPQTRIISNYPEVNNILSWESRIRRILRLAMNQDERVKSELTSFNQDFSTALESRSNEKMTKQNKMIFQNFQKIEGLMKPAQGMISQKKYDQAVENMHMAAESIKSTLDEVQEYDERPITYGRQWLPISKSRRNFVVSDGVNQWRRTYGPTYQTWSLGKSVYVNLNTYDLRQYRRSGWGMYTVNYGGGMSQAQVRWVKREIGREMGFGLRDVTLLTHHDPRGGYKNIMYPFYPRQVPYGGMVDVATNYLMGEVVSPKLCKSLPKWMIKMSQGQTLACLQDGLQEWMRPDFTYDCSYDLKNRPGEPTLDPTDETGQKQITIGSYATDPLAGTCDIKALQFDRYRHPIYSGYQMVHYLASFENIRTFLIGHTHYNSVEVYQEGHELVPNEVILDAESHSKYKEHSSIVEKANPVRWYSWLKNKLSRNQEPTNTKFSEIENRRMATGVVEDPDDELVRLKFADSGHNFQRELTHPLVILRLTSVAKLTEQLTKKGKKTAFGFSILSVDDKQEGGKSLINGVTLLRNIDDGKSNFQVVDPGNGSDMVPIDRRDSYNSLETSKNPFNALFNSEAARPMTDPTQKKHE